MKPGGSVPFCCICWPLGSLWVAMDKTTQTQKPQGFDLGGWLDGVGVTENKALCELDSAAPASPQRLHPSLFPHPQSPPLGHPEPLYFPRAWPPRPLPAFERKLLSFPPLCAVSSFRSQRPVQTSRPSPCFLQSSRYSHHQARVWLLPVQPRPGSLTMEV